MSEGCCVPEEEMMVVRDLNMNAPFKGGNQYCRICPECGKRTFCSKMYWKTADEQYVIPEGEEDPIQRFECPYPDCDGSFFGTVDECPECENEIMWEDDDTDSDQQNEAEAEA